MSGLTKRLICVLLILLMLLSAGPMVFAETLEEIEDDDAIHIGSVQDLMAFAARCSLNTWSNGVKVVLDRDISLSCTAFTFATTGFLG